MAKFGWITVACAGFLLIISAASIAVPAQSFTVLASLDANSASPTSPLVQAAGGKLYGSGTNGHGSIFTITPAGLLNDVCTFNGVEGSSPDLA